MLNSKNLGAGLKALLSTTILASGFAVTAQAATVTRTPTSFSANSGTSGCGIVGGSNSSDNYRVRADNADAPFSGGRFVDEFERIIADGNGAVIARSGLGGTERLLLGETATFNNGATAPVGTYVAPLQVGYIDTGSASNDAVIGLTPVPNSVLTAAGGNCATIVNNFSGTVNLNTDPVLDAIANQTGSLGGSNIVITPTASDVDGDVLTISWTQIGGPSSSGVIISTRNTAVPTSTGGQITIPAPATAGTQVWRATVTDANGATDTQNVNVVWSAANQAPTADAGADQTGTLPDTSSGPVLSLGVNLDGTGSSDPDAGDTLTYAWSLISGPPSTFGDASNAQDNSFISVRAPSTAGTQVWRLTVTDTDGLTSTDDVNIVWSAPPNAAPVLPNLGSAVGIVGGNDIVSFITASDVDGDAVTFTYDLQSGPASSVSIASAPTTVVNGTGANVTITPPTTAGTQVYLVTATDPSGATDTQTVNVVWNAAANQAPIADAGPNQTIVNAAPNTTVTLDGSGSSDPENSTLTYAWRQLSGPSVTLMNPTSVRPSFVYQPVQQLRASTGSGTLIDNTRVVATQTVAVGQAADTFRFELIVSDGTDSSVADEVEIVINENNTPVADAGDDETFFNLTATDSFSLDGSGSSDPDGDTLTYAWTQSAGRTLTITGANTATPSLTYGAGTFGESFTLDLIVSDGVLSSVADSVTITVDDNRAPVAMIAPVAAAASSGGVVTLDATGSTDADGNSLTYSWVQISGPTVTLMNGDTATPSFTAPEVTSQSAIVFEVTVSDGSDSTQAQVSVTVMPTGSITIVQNTTGGNDSFNFSSSLAALDGTITTTNGSGSLIAEDVVAGTYVVTAADARAAGFALTDLSCNDTDSTVDLPARQATIILAAGESVTCSFDSVNSRGAAQAAISDFVNQRGTLILSNGPDVSRRIGRLSGQSQAPQGVAVAGLTLPGSQHVPITAAFTDGGGYLSASLSQLRAQHGADNVDSALGGTLGKSFSEGRVDIWGEATFADFNNNSQDGNFSIFHGGVDYLISDRLLVGAMVSFDNFDNGDNNLAGEGNGFLAGPYATARLSDNIYLDGRVLFGGSDNSISPLGTSVDDFDTDRTLFAGSISGEFGEGKGYNFTPTLEVRHLSETQNAYTDSLGVVITEQGFDLGEVSFAPRLEKTFNPSPDWTLSPYVEVEGIYSYGDHVDTVLGSDTRMRLELGTSLSSDAGLRAGLSLFADGIGADNFSSEGVRLSLSYTIK